MRLSLFLLLALLIISIGSIAQSSYDDPNSVSIPSANNDFLKSQSDFGMSTYTGAPKIDFPIYSLASKVLTIPISMSYTSSAGIKVQDVANFVGLGWQLNAGGNISRVVRGLPDEQTNGYIGVNGSGAALAGGVTSTLISQVASGQIDGEPDLFTITTPYFSFRFTLDQNGSPVFSNSTGFRITHNLYNNANYINGTSWTVTDDNGNQYLFGTTARESTTTKLFSTSQTFVSTWYLEKIIAFNSRDIIVFSYHTGSDYSVSHYRSSSNYYITSNTCSYSGTNPQVTNDSIVYTYNTPQYIAKISTSLGEADFNYTFGRQDIINAAQLTSVIVYPFDQVGLPTPVPAKTFQFSYSYFGAPTTNPGALRLRLDNITLAGNGSESPLLYKSFDYYTTTNLPPRNSVEFDYWGYYNTNGTGTAIVPTANKSPDATRAIANILVGVHDLSGEIQKMQYELNTYYNSSTSANVTVGGLRVNQLIKQTPSGETLYTTYIYNDANGHSTGQIYNNNYLYFNKNMVIWLAGQSSACGIGMTNTMSESLYNSYDLNGNFVGYSSVKILSQNGGYEMDQFTNFSDFPDQFNYGNTGGASYGFDNSRQLSAATSFAYKRGLLTSKITYTAAGNMVSGTTYVYTTLDQVAGRGNGLKSNSLTITNGTVTDWVYGSYNTYSENYLLAQATERNYDQNNQALYREVVSNYTYAANHRLVQKIDYTDSKGLARNKTFYYTEDANIPAVTGNEQYAINLLLAANNTNTLLHSTETHNGQSFNTHYSYLDFKDAGLNDKIFLASKSTYNNNSPLMEKEQYQYDLSGLQLVAVNKAGAPFLSTLYGYNNCYMTAKVRNALNLTSTSISNGSYNGTLTFANVNGPSQTVNFTVGYTGSVALQLVAGGTGSGSRVAAMSVTLTGPASYSGSGCVSSTGSCGTNSAYLTFTNVPPGNYSLIVGTSSSSSTTTSAYVYYSFPQYQGSSTATNEFFYEGFESSASAATATPFAGKKYNSGTYTVPFTIPNARSYQIDYHYLSGGVWYAKTKPYQNSMVLNDGTAIDEVRVYPVDAQMLTYTYNPLFGITSQCDSRNRFTFYEYDGFGRLARIRDNDGNILNNYDYKYQVPIP